MSSIHFPEANQLTANLFESLKRHPKRVVFSEGEDERVIRVAEQLVKMEIMAPILLGNKECIRALAGKIGADLKFVNVLDPRSASDLDLFCRRLEKVEKYRGRVVKNPQEMVSRPHNFASMMVQYGQADCVVSGNQSTPATVYRAFMNFIKPEPSVPKLFGAVAMVAPHLEHFGRDGLLILADCGMNPEPSVEELASFAIESGKLAGHFLGREPRVAMLSHSTLSSMPTKSSKKVAAASVLATEMAARQNLELDIDGEVQADVALDMAAAEVKLKNVKQLHPADVLVFPNLDSSHIAFKLLQHVGGAACYGQIAMGLTKPAAQVPTTVTEEGLLGTAALVGVRAIITRQIHEEKRK